MPALDAVAMICGSASEAWSEAVTYMLGRLNVYVADPTKFTVPSVDFIGGYVGIVISDSTDPSQTINYFFVVDGLTEMNFISVREFLEGPGGSTSIGVPFVSGVTNDNAAYTACKNWILHGKQNVMTGLTTLGSFTFVDHEIITASLAYKTLVRISTITDVGQFYAMVDGIRGGSNPRGAWGWTPCKGPLFPNVQGAVAAIDTSGIIEAIQDIADQDAEFSLNQNSTMWSVRSSVIVGG